MTRLRHSLPRQGYVFPPRRGWGWWVGGSRGERRRGGEGIVLAWIGGWGRGWRGERDEDDHDRPLEGREKGREGGGGERGK